MPGLVAGVRLRCLFVFLSTSEPKLEAGPTGQSLGTGLGQVLLVGLRGGGLSLCVDRTSQPVLKSQHWPRALPSLSGLSSP